MRLTAAFLVGGGCEATADRLRDAADCLPAGSRLSLVRVPGEHVFACVQVVVTAGGRGQVVAALGCVTECARRLPVGCLLTVAVRRPWGAQAVRLRVWEDGLRLEGAGA